MLKTIFNLFRYFPFYFKLYKDFKRTQRYTHKLLSEVKPLYPNWSSIVDSENQKRMNDYILIQTMWTAGFCLLRGERIKDNELKAIVNISALAPLYDDFFDKVEMPGEKIHALVNTPFAYKPESDIESLFLEFSKRIHENVKNVPFYLENAKRVFKAQLISKKLVSDTPLDRAEVKDIAFEKGASTVICMCNMLNKPLTNEEDGLMFQLGGIAQFLDDIFDLREDYLEGRQTLANPMESVEVRKREFILEIKTFNEELGKLSYSTSNKKAFLVPVTFILGAALLCLDRYLFLEKKSNGVFQINKYAREELVVDMDETTNRWKALKLSNEV